MNLTRLALLLAMTACKDGPATVDDSVPDTDRDGDGYAAPADCDDDNPQVYPSAIEICDGIDNDCDGQLDTDANDLVLSYADADQDGHGDPLSPQYTCSFPEGAATNADDCDDSDPNIYAGAPERCDGLDDDCDGVPDDEALDILIWPRDADGDGYGDPLISRGVAACEQPPGYADNSDDCDDSRGDVHPNAAEVCDDEDTDEDCDGLADDAGASGQTEWYPDLDGDGFGSALSSTRACDGPSGWVADAADCDDRDPAIHPAATEVCDPDHTDEDCDGAIDGDDPTVDLASGAVTYPDSDNDSFGDEDNAGLWACEPPNGSVLDHSDCDDSLANVYPGAAEICDGANTDEDCDGLADDDDSSVSSGTMSSWYADSDSDGYGNFTATALRACDDPSSASLDYALSRSDCDDASAAISPAASERCDAADVDEDCDGLSDDQDASVDLSTGQDWLPDADLDGYGSDAATALVACDDPSTASAEYLLDASDCDDSSSAINPLATESCNSLDDDCDGVVDNDEVLVGSVSACPGYSCLDIFDLRTSTPSSGFFYIDPNSDGSATRVYCDMVTDGGGYTFLKVAPGSAYYAANAESYCTALGMQLFVPRSANHRTAALTVARSTSYGGSNSDYYLYILGIYPSYGTNGSGSNGARCISTAMNSASCTLWGPGDGGPYYVSAKTTVTEPNGDNDLGASMYYTWSGSDVNWYNDIPWPGYASSYFMCDVGDKWGNGLTRP